MVFSSLEFIFVFLASVLATYYLVPPKARNFVLLLFSLVFYGWGEPLYVFLMIFTITVDYVCGFIIGRSLDKANITDREQKRPKAAKVTLVLSIVINLAILGFFKYWDFFAGTINSIIPTISLPTVSLALPIGISFYTFQALSYVIDVYRRDAKMQRNIASFGTYVTLFPQLIAGPIVRYADVDDQLRGREHSMALFASGVRTFVCGLCKKVLLANSAGALWKALSGATGDANLGVSGAASATALGSWLVVIFYTFQIYFDFSGYSDMAIGLGKMFGFSFRENFYYPYVSSSVTEFWRRWHISLSTWFREYVYIPLGGNRVSMPRWLLNLFVVWALTGLWHGASWNFVLWGLYYYVLLVFEKAIFGKLLAKAPKFVGHVYTLIVVMFGWLLFASDSLSTIGTYLSNMFTAPFSNGIVLWDLVRNVPFIIILCIASTPFPKRLYYRLREKAAFRYAAPVLTVLALALCTAYLVDSSYNPFLYFRF